MFSSSFTLKIPETLKTRGGHPRNVDPWTRPEPEKQILNPIRLLFPEYITTFNSHDHWPSSISLSTLSSLILQMVFRSPMNVIRSFNDASQFVCFILDMMSPPINSSVYWNSHFSPLCSMVQVPKLTLDLQMKSTLCPSMMLVSVVCTKIFLSW